MVLRFAVLVDFVVAVHIEPPRRRLGTRWGTLSSLLFSTTPI